MKEVYEIHGKEYPITGYIEDKGKFYPIVDIPMMSDIEWQRRCLESRLMHPEGYAVCPEGWAARYWEEPLKAIAGLEQWLAENDPDYLQWSAELNAKLDAKYGNKTFELQEVAG